MTETIMTPHHLAAGSPLDLLLTTIATTWPAVTYHPEDPDRDAIEATATTLNLTPVPDPTIGYRTVRGTNLPTPTVPDTAVEAVTGAVVAVANNPLAVAACAPTDPDRHRRIAQELLVHLAAAGWNLTRTLAPTPAAAGTP